MIKKEKPNEALFVNPTPTTTMTGVFPSNIQLSWQVLRMSMKSGLIRTERQITADWTDNFDLNLHSEDPTNKK